MFRIRLITTSSTSLKNFFANALSQEKWRPGLKDIECLLVCDPTGIYVGDLDDKPIAVMSIIKYEDGYRHFGSYFVDKQYRNQGYGSKLFNEVLKKSAPMKNISLYAMPAMAKKYEKSLNVVKQWSVETYDLNISKVVKALQESPVSPPFIDVKRTNEVDTQALYNYDTSVFGYNRQQFSKQWFRSNGMSHARVAVDKEGSIVGYVVVRLVFNKDEGYRIGPLFCESIEVAKILLKETLQEIIELGMSSSQSVMIDSPIEINPEVKEFITLLEGVHLFHCEYMTSNGLPRGRFNNWFAITTLEAG